MSVNKIDVVLACYNGEQFLEEQIRSIQEASGYAQCIQKLLIVDDGSTDESQKIVKRLAQLDSKIKWLVNTSGKHGPCHNFSFGLSQTTSNYIMLSDQDDIWFACKIERCLQKMLDSEQKGLNLTPILIFSDKEIVDQGLNLLCGSYFQLKSINKEWHHKIEQLCQQNVISGCTMLFNRALLEIALPVPDDAYMHDWWFALVAIKCGKIEFIDEPLIQYRQHNDNTIGANQRTKFDLIKRFSHHLKQFEDSLEAIIKQANAFIIFERKNNLVHNETIKILASLEFFHRHRRVVFWAKKIITRSNFFGRLALLIVLLKMKVRKPCDRIYSTGD